MLESVRKISNPLTIIAIFAGIVEVSGSIILPILINDAQMVYVWFLIAFPCILVTAFFLTLNFNSGVLYAPSDYRDENNFIQMFKKPTSADRIEKLQIDINALLEKSATSVPELTTGPAPTLPVQLPEKITSKPPIIRQGGYERLLSEEMALLKINKDFDTVQREILIESDSGRYLFDALGKKGNKYTAIEIVQSEGYSDLQSIVSKLKSMNTAVEHMNKSFDATKGLVEILLVVVCTTRGQNHEKTKSILLAKSEFITVPLSIKVYDLNDLKNEFRTALRTQ